MSQRKKKVVCFFLTIVVVTILTVAVRIVSDGMYLLGLPNPEDVQSVGISYSGMTEETKELSSPDDIKLAVNLTGFLKYDLFEPTDAAEEPLVTITYYLGDGTNKVIAANRTTVWWKGKAHTVKDKETFVTLTKALFFLREAQSE